MRSRKDLGQRKQPRVEFQLRPAFIMLAPDAPWLECSACDISGGGVRLDVGSLVVPRIFAVSFTPDESVFRLCEFVWRNGPLVGARFIQADDVRRILRGEAADANDQLR